MASLSGEADNGLKQSPPETSQKKPAQSPSTKKPPAHLAKNAVVAMGKPDSMAATPSPDVT